MNRSNQNEGLTDDELALAQHLLGVYEGTHRWARRVDPQNRRDSMLAIRLDQMRADARDAFFDLTGRLPHRVMMAELSTTNPAAWTKLPWKQRD